MSGTDRDLGTNIRSIDRRRTVCRRLLICREDGRSCLSRPRPRFQCGADALGGGDRRRSRAGPEPAVSDHVSYALGNGALELAAGRPPPKAADQFVKHLLADLGPVRSATDRDYGVGHPVDRL